MPESAVIAEVQGTTLADRLAGGQLPVRDVVRCAANIAGALRQIHDQGLVYGGLDTSQVLLTESGACLCPGEARSGDPRADIFDFGAVLYEMLTGSRLSEPEPQPPARLDPPGAQLLRIAMKCRAKEPEQRYQRVQKILMELKLLTMRRLDGEEPGQPQSALVRRDEVAALEARFAARLESQNADLAELRGGMEDVRQAQADVRAGISALEQRMMSHLSAQEDHIADLETAAQEQLAGLTSSVKQLITAVEESVAGQLHGLEEGLRAQAHTVECMKVTMAQTDDLIERVVDAFDALQESILASPSERNG
jgi:hypothetical protein